MVDNCTFRLNKSSFLLSIGICIYRFLLDIIYINLIVPKYQYAGFTDQHNIISFAISWILAIASIPLILTVIHNIEKRISNFIISIIYFISFIPFTTLIYANEFEEGYIIGNAIYWIILIIWQNYFQKKKINPIKIVRNIKWTNLTIYLITIISIGTVCYISFRYTGFRVNFNFDIIYELRAENSLYQLPTILQYFFSWTTAINSILLAYCIIQKRNIWAISIFVVQMLSFGINGSKTTFFTAILTILICEFYSNKHVKSLKYILVYGLVSIFIIVILQKILTNSTFLSDVFLRRGMFVPVELGSSYFDFFSNHEPDYFRGSFLRHLGFETPYPDLQRTIAEIYYNSAANANNGLISDAITNMGYIGILIMPFILTLILHMLDCCTYKLDIRIMFVTSVYLSSELSNTFLSRTLLSHGLLAVMLVSLLLKRDENTNIMENKTAEMSKSLIYKERLYNYTK